MLTVKLAWDFMIDECRERGRSPFQETRSSYCPTELAGALCLEVPTMKSEVCFLSSSGVIPVSSPSPALLLSSVIEDDEGAASAVKAPGLQTAHVSAFSARDTIFCMMCVFVGVFTLALACENRDFCQTNCALNQRRQGIWVVSKLHCSRFQKPWPVCCKFQSSSSSHFIIV